MLHVLKLNHRKLLRHALVARRFATKELPQPMSIYGKERTQLGATLSNIMNKMKPSPRYFLDNGTLLGLWRNGQLIDKDDDFDFGILINKSEFSSTWLDTFQRAVQIGLDEHRDDSSDAASSSSTPNYQSRVVTTYADKIEVYDASHGSFPLHGDKYQGARYHHVSCDLQLHVIDDDDVVEKKIKVKEDASDGSASAAATAVLISEEVVLTGNQGVKIHHSDFSLRGKAPSEVYEPFLTMQYEGIHYPVPQQTTAYLSYLYGYLGLGAELDEHTKLYRKALVPAAATASTAGSKQPSLRLYTDMCADLFHTGHVNYLRQCCGVSDEFDVHLIVGIHSDATIESYKRASVCTMNERVDVVRSCKYVNEVLPNAPLRVTKEFLEDNSIDFVIHGTETPEVERQAMYSIPISLGKYTEVPRTEGISTTDIIDRIASRLRVDYCFLC
jgi:cytidyltransferase-like protein